LVLVSATTIGSAVSSVTVSNAFSSTYDNYLIILGGGVASAVTGLVIRLGSTTTGYYAGYVKIDPSGTVTGEGDNNNAAWSAVGGGNTSVLNAEIFVGSPNLAKNTVMYSRMVVPRTSAQVAYLGGGWLNDTTQYTAFTILPVGTTLTGGTIRVYGYANS
jgi:hypothetical protein